MKKISGFTMMEAMIVVALMAIVTVYAIPSMTDIIKNNRLAMRTNDFVGAMQIARSEAIKRGETIRVKSVTNGTWKDGWEVVTIGLPVVTIKQYEPLPATITMNSTFTVYNYSATGLIDNGDTLTLCDDRTGEIGRSIRITSSGNISSGPTSAPCS